MLGGEGDGWGWEITGTRSLVTDERGWIGMRLPAAASWGDGDTTYLES